MLKSLLACCLAFNSLLAVASEPIIIRFSHVVAPETPKGQGALLLQQLVEQRLAGKVKIEVYPQASLFGDEDELAALQDNRVQLLAPSLSKLSVLEPRLQVFDLPFMFSDQDEVERFQRRPYGQALLEGMHPHKLVGLAYWHDGLKQFTANRPLRHPQDVSGLRFRISDSAVLAAQFEALHASSEVVPFSETYQAISSGQVQGSENSWSNLQSTHLDEVQSWITESNHSFNNYMLLSNPEFWYSMPQDVRSELEEIIAEVTWSVRKNAEALNEQARQQVKTAGLTHIVQLSEQERENWRRQLHALWHQFADVIGEDLLAAAERAGNHQHYHQEEATAQAY